MEIPWKNLKIIERKFVCQDDEKVSFDKSFDLSIKPLPFIGNPDAPFYILMNNPGSPITELDEEYQKTEVFDMNLGHEANTFFPLDYDSGWWTAFFKDLTEIIGLNEMKTVNGKIRKVITAEGKELINKTFFALEITGYHSVGFNYRKVKKIPSTGYSKELVRRVLQEKEFLKPRANDYWFLHVPELVRSHKVHHINGNRKPTLGIKTTNRSVLHKIFEHMNKSVEYENYLDRNYKLRI